VGAHCDITGEAGLRILALEIVKSPPKKKVATATPSSTQPKKPLKSRKQS
jgi:hypothetical protein